MQQSEPWQEVRTDVRTLYAEHLGHALDLLRQSLSGGEEEPCSAQYLQSQRCAMSAIIHAFSSLEAALNFMAYRMFTIKDAREFIPIDERGFFVQSMIRRWRDLKIMEKCNVVLSVSHASILPNEVHSRLSELNTLRNWLVHGKSYHSIIRVSPSDDAHILYEVVDEQPGQDWREKFPLCRFNEPLAVNRSDAQTALRVIIETLAVLSRGTGFKWFYTTCIPHLTVCGFSGECDIDALLSIKETKRESCSDGE